MTVKVESTKSKSLGYTKSQLLMLCIVWQNCHIFNFPLTAVTRGKLKGRSSFYQHKFGGREPQARAFISQMPYNWKSIPVPFYVDLKNPPIEFWRSSVLMRVYLISFLIIGFVYSFMTFSFLFLFLFHTLHLLLLHFFRVVLSQAGLQCYACIMRLFFTKWKPIIDATVHRGRS